MPSVWWSCIEWHGRPLHVSTISHIREMEKAIKWTNEEETGNTLTAVLLCIKLKWLKGIVTVNAVDDTNNSKNNDRIVGVEQTRQFTNSRAWPERKPLCTPSRARQTVHGRSGTHTQLWVHSPAIPRARRATVSLILYAQRMHTLFSFISHIIHDWIKCIRRSENKWGTRLSSAVVTTMSSEQWAPARHAFRISNSNEVQSPGGWAGPHTMSAFNV